MNGQSEVVSILFAGGANTEATDDEVRREMGLREEWCPTCRVNGGNDC